ncbi:MAG: F0F1 ATP synthase subunit alpha [Planctomycetota bacterium]
MTDLRAELAAWLPRARARALAFEPAPRREQVGVVERVGDGVAEVTGLPDVRLDELVRFSSGAQGLVVRLDERSFGCFLLGEAEGRVAGGRSVAAGDEVRGTGSVLKVPVGQGLLGRVIDPLGAPLDGGAPLQPARWDPVEREAPPIADRDLVTTPLQTGVLVVDAMVPLGRGQRELIVGDRKTGKTAIAVDAIASQRDSDVISVYAAIGQKESSVERVVEALRARAAFDRCLVVVGEASSLPGTQWLAPYAACSMAEYFRDRGQDVLLVLDDLSQHAIIHRQLSLLLRSPPGREAYPGDVFYLHGRLLERAAKLAPERGGGSLTALPIAETQEGNLTAYIPTNLISITDGQVYLEPKLFYEGHKPAVDVTRSISRVGGQTQAPALRHLSERLRLEYAQFLELESFTRFGGLADERARRSLEHGRRMRALLEQPRLDPLRLSEEVALLLALEEHLLDDTPPEGVRAVQARAREVLAARCPANLARIDHSRELSPEDRARLLEVLRDVLGAPAPEAPPAEGPPAGAGA